MSRRSCKIDAGGEEVEVKYTDISSFVARVGYKDDDTEDGYTSVRRVNIEAIGDLARVRRRRDITKNHIQAAVDMTEERAEGDFELVSVRVIEAKTVRRYWAGSD